MRREALRGFDMRPEFASRVMKRAGLTLELERTQAWIVGGRRLTVMPWLDHDFRYVLLIRDGWPPPAPKSLSLAQVFAAAVSGELRDFKRSDDRPSPELARWKARALIEFGEVEAPRIEMKPLPPTAPESAVVTWAVVKSLLQARRVVDEDDEAGLPLVVPFLARWSGVDESTLIAGRRWLDRHGYIDHIGERPTGAGKPMVIWSVAASPLPAREQAILRDLEELLGAREVEE